MPVGQPSHRSDSVLWEQDSCAAEKSFATGKSDLTIASHSQLRRSVRRDVEAKPSRQSGVTTTPPNHREK